MVKRTPGVKKKVGRPRKSKDKTEYCTPVTKTPLSIFNKFEVEQLRKTLNMDDVAFLMKNCCVPCKVHIKRLPEEEIVKYTSEKNEKLNTNIQDQPLLKEKKVVQHNLRDNSRVTSELFNQFKRSRKKYLNRKLHQAEMGDFNGSSSEEIGASSGEEFKIDGPSTSTRHFKKKKLSYEDDMEWDPNCDNGYNPNAIIPRKKGLRINLRRKRIESSSSSADEEFLNYASELQNVNQCYSENTRSPVRSKKISGYKKANVSKSPKKKYSVRKTVKKRSTNSPPDFENKSISEIIQHMKNFKNQNGKKQLLEKRKNLKINESNGSNADEMYPPVKQRKSHLFNIADESTSAVNSVQAVLFRIVNAICRFEGGVVKINKNRKKKCKWCEAPINKVNYDLCVKCRKVSKDSKNILQNANVESTLQDANGKSTMQDANGESTMQDANGESTMQDANGVSTLQDANGESTLQDANGESTLKNKNANKVKSFKGGMNNKFRSTSTIKNKLYKNLPKYDQQRLAGQFSIGKGYNHLKSLKSPEFSDVSEKEIKHPSSNVGDSSLIENSENVKVKKKRKLTASNKSDLKVAKKKKRNTEIPKSNELKSTVQSSASPVLKTIKNNRKQMLPTTVQNGIFSITLPDSYQELEIPKIKAKLGFYKNIKNLDKHAVDITKKIPLKKFKNKRGQLIVNNAQHGSASLPSMPSLDKLSETSPSPLDLPLTYELGSLPSTNIINSSIEDPIETFKERMIASVSISTSIYSPEPNLQIFSNSMTTTSIPYETPIDGESSISSFLNNPQLAIDTIPSGISGDAFISFENPDLHSAVNAPAQNTSTFATEGYNGSDFGALIKDVTCANSNIPSLSNIFDQTIQTKQSDNCENSDINKDSNKISGSCLELSSSISDSLENFSYPSEIENLSSEALFHYCSAELDALCILCVVDMSNNPKWSLNERIVAHEKEVEKYKNAGTVDKDIVEKLKMDELILKIALSLQNHYGNFMRLSDSMQKKTKFLQIKKESNLESSCQFSNSHSVPFPQEISKINEGVSLSTVLAMENESCNFIPQSTEPVNHIKKIQTQIQSMQENSLFPESEHLGIVHHYPSIMPAIPSITPRTDITTSEFRETPSRGSGPRTPARPESAMSHNEERILTPMQVKKENFEASASSLSQCAYSQNTYSTHLPVVTPNISQSTTPVNNLAYSQNTFSSPHLSIATSNITQSTIPVNNLAYSQNPLSPHLSVATSNISQSTVPVNNLAVVDISPANTQVVNTFCNQSLQCVPPNVSISNNNQIQNVLRMQQRHVLPPNMTVPFHNNPNFSKFFLNLATKQPQPPPSNIATSVNHNIPTTNVIIGNGQMYNVHQVVLPRTTSVPPRYAQPSMNNTMNHYVYKQPTASTERIVVNNTGQNNYGIPNTIANTAVINSQQVSQVCNTNSYQQSMQQIPNSINQASANAALLMSSNKEEVASDMFCAVCGKSATLRCKQCAKVAYCNTNCAKSYWHARHKMECKSMLG
ncbi:hypothetical protein CDAR_18141 [Caerostris darwini]|uniref:MYND-type domain-containing protein n=1 Tax=Caerostris darwini TaxID=1538125 RepID=A0AAV4R198_9ARAC|nr:hypothetical protein CDAR_18141 [Caerostris darwini]